MKVARNVVLAIFVAALLSWVSFGWTWLLLLMLISSVVLATLWWWEGNVDESSSDVGMEGEMDKLDRRRRTRDLDSEGYDD